MLLTIAKQRYENNQKGEYIQLREESNSYYLIQNMIHPDSQLFHLGRYIVLYVYL